MRYNFHHDRIRWRRILPLKHSEISSEKKIEKRKEIRQDTKPNTNSVFSLHCCGALQLADVLHSPEVERETEYLVAHSRVTGKRNSKHL